MVQTYTVKLMDEEEWADLVKSDRRYEHVTEDNLGFSDPLKCRAVSYTHLTLPTTPYV